MKKTFLKIFFVGYICQIYAADWYGFIPVRIQQGIPYFLLHIEQICEQHLESTQPVEQKASLPLTAARKLEKLVPFVGGYLSKNQTKQQLLLELLPINEPEMAFEKLPYMFYQDKSDTNHQQNCFRFWWPSSYSQIHKARSDSSGLTFKKPETTFFGWFADINQDFSNSKYKIYFVPLNNASTNMLKTGTAKWFSIQDLEAAFENKQSLFLEKLLAMFKSMNQGSDNQWEKVNSVIAYDMKKHLNFF